MSSPLTIPPALVRAESSIITTASTSKLLNAMKTTRPQHEEEEATRPPSSINSASWHGAQSEAFITSFPSRTTTLVSQTGDELESVASLPCLRRRRDDDSSNQDYSAWQAWESQTLSSSRSKRALDEDSDDEEEDEEVQRHMNLPGAKRSRIDDLLA